jgi:hypothetical protein
VRSPKELAFRLRQETANLLLLAHAPRATSQTTAPLAGLPDPRKVAALLAGSEYAANVERWAEEVLRHRFPLLGLTIETGPEIDWRRDYISGRTTPIQYFRLIPYLNFERAGDHKIIWELNRHQHLVLLAQAYLFTGRDEFLDEITAELKSWWAANPYGRSINWSSALEVAFRALSWIWVYHLAGDRMSKEFRQRFLQALYAHGRHLEFNFSVYFSPHTHLLGEAVALHALGTLFRDFPGAARWRRQGGQWVRAHMEEKVNADGSYSEQSSYYHVYAMDMLLFASRMEKMPEAYGSKLERMGDYLDALLGPSRRLPYLGDDDGGRFFHPYGERERFGRASLAACAQFTGGNWEYTREDAAEMAVWLGGTAGGQIRAEASRGSRLFEDAGVAILRAGETQVVMDAGPFGAMGAGHSHSDTLSLVVRRAEADILVDPGTYTYIAEPEWRNWFRGSAAHNTVRIDGLDQGTVAGPFRWSSKPQVTIEGWRSMRERDYLDAVCAYRGFRHRRRVLFVKPDRLFVLDTVDGLEGQHWVEQFWHAGQAVTEISPRRFRIGESAQLLLTHAGGCEDGWRSPAPGKRVPAPVVRAEARGALAVRMGAVLDLSGGSMALEMRRENGATILTLRGSQPLEVRFGAGDAVSRPYRVSGESQQELSS